ncbi:MAG: outer membrane protein OmpA-like peptidoglycan-associated protein, partial [Bradymonadia bacterium]
YATPFIELAISQPLGAPCIEDEGETQICVGNSEPATWPMWATLGVRSQPVRGLAFTLAADLGLTTKESQGTPAVPAWSFLLGASYNLDPRGGGPTRERIVEVPVEVPVGVMTSYVEGFVRETGGGAAIAGAQVEYMNQSDFTSQTTDSTGRFRSYDFEPGTALSLRVTHPDYLPSDFDIVVGTEMISGPVELAPAFDGVLFSGSIEMAAAAPTIVSLRGPESYDLVVEEGAFSAEIQPGDYDIIVHALGYQALRESATLSAGRVENAFTLEALEPNSTLRFTADALVIDSPSNRVDFENAALTPQATATLDEIARTMNENPTMRLLVRSHTDPREEDESVDELGLTAQRAEVVKAYLVANGVAAGRLEIDGVGSAEPKFPNVTERNRRFNNRVEFEILR